MGACKQCEGEIPDDEDDSAGFCSNKCWDAWTKARHSAELNWYRAREAQLIEYAAGRSDSLSVLVVDHVGKREVLGFDNESVEVVKAEDGIPLPWWAEVEKLALDDHYGGRENVLGEALLQKTLPAALADLMDFEAERILRQAMKRLRDGERGPDGELWDSRFEKLIPVLIAHFSEQVPEKDDTVVVEDRHSKHYGKTGLVSFVKDDRVYVSMAEPRSIAGHSMESFPPGKVRVVPTMHQRESAERALDERRVTAKVLQENVILTENLTSTQERCTQLLLATRTLRQRIVELGGEDPGAP